MRYAGWPAFRTEAPPCPKSVKIELHRPVIFLVSVLRQIHEMIGNMKCGVPRRFAPLLAVCWILVLFVAQRTTAQEPASPGPLDFPDLKTSAWGPLQERLEKAFPDSFEKGVDIFWEKRDGWISPEVLDWWKLSVEDDGRQDLTWEDAGSRRPTM
jgi:hypothetical protein